MGKASEFLEKVKGLNEDSEDVLDDLWDSHTSITDDELEKDVNLTQLETFLSTVGLSQDRVDYYLTRYEDVLLQVIKVLDPLKDEYMDLWDELEEEITPADVVPVPAPEGDYDYE